MAKGVCKVPGCGRKEASSGYCMTHYLREWRKKESVASERRDEVCFLGGCGRKVYSGGLCREHYRRLDEGDPDWARPISSGMAKWWAEHPEERERRSRQIWSRATLPESELMRKAERYCLSRMLDPTENRHTTVLWFRALVCYALPGSIAQTDAVKEVEASGFVVGLVDANGWAPPVFFGPSVTETTRDAGKAYVFRTRSAAVNFSGSMDPGEGRRTRIYQRARAVAGDFGFYA